MFLDILSWLYSLSGVVIVAGFLPQITKLIGATGRSVAVSLFSWWIWAATSAVAVTYGVLIVKDWRFTLLAALHLTCELTVACLVLYNRYVRFEAEGFAWRTMWHDARSALRRVRLAQPD